MKITTRTPSLLILEDKPGMESLLSYSMIGVGIILILGDFYQHVERQTLFWVGIAFAVLGLIGYFRFDEYTRTIFDKSSEKLLIHRKPPFRQVRAESHSLGEIQKIQIESPDKQPEGREYYRLALQMRNGRAVPLARKAHAGLEDCESIAKRIQFFLGEEVGQHG